MYFFIFSFISITKISQYSLFPTLRITKLAISIWLQKRKGVEGLIEIENPNRIAQKAKKVTEIELEGPKQLSRRER